MFTENVQALIAEVRNEEEQFHKDVTDISVAFLDRFSKGEVDGPVDIPDELLDVGCTCTVAVA